MTSSERGASSGPSVRSRSRLGALKMVLSNQSPAVLGRQVSHVQVMDEFVEGNSEKRRFTSL